MKRTRLRQAAPALAVVASLLAVASAALAAPLGGIYKGTNSQFPARPLTFRVSQGGKSVLNFQPTFVSKCTKATSSMRILISTNAGTNIPITNNAFDLRAAHGAIHNGSKVVASATVSIHGAFTSTHSAKGTYSVQFTFNRSSGKFAGYRCKTGTLRWTAHRKQ